jgi:hypothetical protein
VSFPNIIFGADGNQFTVSTEEEGGRVVGSRMHFDDGRQFRYTQAGGVAVVVGKLYQAAIPVSNHVLQTPPAVAVGARTIPFVLGATAATADQYKDGYFVVDLATNTGFGYLYGIDTHPAVASSGTFSIPLTSPVQVAISTQATSCSLVPNTYRGPILAIATTPTAKIAGFSVKPLPISNFGWLCTKGPVMCLTTGGINIAEKVIPSTTTGAVIIEAAYSIYPCVGEVLRVAVTTAYSTINANVQD